MGKCSICHANIESEDPAVLTMSAFGRPLYICEECEKDLDDATLSKDPEVISAAIENIGRKIKEANNDDNLTLTTVSEIVENATERGEMIRSGVYDFENDELNDESADEVPEELLETEEDKELDEKEKKSNEKVDKILNWITLAVTAGVVGYLFYWFISSFI